MLSNTQNSIETLITKLLIDSRYVKAVEYGHQHYQIRQFKIQSLTPTQIFSIYYLLKSRFYYKRPAPNSDNWYQNQLKIFIWLLVCYSYVEQKHIQEMQNQHWHFFSKIFNNKNPDIFEFQAKCIVKKKLKSAKWTKQQVNLLDSIIKQKNKKNKWNQIANELFIASEKKYFRTAKQCREHWINHLDPVPIRTQWKIQQDLKLVKSVMKAGKKWSKVSKIFNGRRTQHMIKNRFNSLYHSELKYLKIQHLKQVKEQDIIKHMQQRLALDIDQNNSNSLKQGVKYQNLLQQQSHHFLLAQGNSNFDNIQNSFNEIEGDLRSQDDEGFKIPQLHQDIQNFKIETNSTIPSLQLYDCQNPFKYGLLLNLQDGQDFRSFLSLEQ